VSGVLRGTLIGDSLRPGAALELADIRVVRIALWDQRHTVGPGQPEFWTVLDFEAPEDAADRVGAALAGVLSPVGGWYCDFAAGGDRFVVYADTVFRYRRGDGEGRAAAVAHGRAAGVRSTSWTGRSSGVRCWPGPGVTVVGSVPAPLPRPAWPGHDGSMAALRSSLERFWPSRRESAFDESCR
jgi:hypothetical protein